MDAPNVITSSNSDYGKITTTVGALGTGSIAVLDAIMTYPQGSSVGFTILDENALIQLSLFNSLTICTYNNGVQQECKSGTNLLELSLLGIFIGPGPGVHNVGFKTTLPYDEVRISAGSLASLINRVRVYGAFVDTRGSNGDSLVCCYAGPDIVNVCGGTSTTVTGTPNGGTWSQEAGNPIGATVGSTINGVVTISFANNAVGVYNFIFGTGTCSDTMNITVDAKPNAGVDQNLSCIALPGGLAVVTGDIAGVWTAQAGNPGTSTITTINSTTAEITNFSVAGVYNYILIAGTGCSDTISITVLSKPNAGVDIQNICGGQSVTLTGTPTSGTWSQQAGNPAGANLGSTLNGEASVSFSNASSGVYNFIFTTGACSDTMNVTVNSKPNAGIDQNLNCVSLPGGLAVVTGDIAGTWTEQSGNPGTSTITTLNSTTAQITNFSVAGVYNYIFTTGAGCSDTMSITVVSKPNAGADIQNICAGEDVILIGNPTNGTWSQQVGNPVGANLGTTLNGVAIVSYSGTAVGVYNFIFSTGSCSDTMNITVNAKPNAGVDQSICATVPGGIANLSSSGVGSWSVQAGNPGTATIVSPLSSMTQVINFSSLGAYNFIFTSSDNCTDTVSINVIEEPIGSANPQTICSGFTTNIILSSTVPGTIFTWTVAQFSGAVINGYSDCVMNCDNTIVQLLNNTSNSASGIIRYSVVPIAPNGCIGNTFTVDVTVDPKPSVTITNMPSCVGLNNGTAHAEAANGTPPYSYLWSNGELTADINGLSPNTFTVTVTDANGCSSTSSTSIFEQGISSLTAIPGPCNTQTNTYTLDGLISILNPPSTGTLTVSVGAIQQVFFAPFTNPQMYSLNGLISDGLNHVVTAIFSDGSQCSKSTNYIAPESCSSAILHNKTFVSATQTSPYTYNLVYKIVVNNFGAVGEYDLTDIPGVDDDVSINSASFISDALGNPGNVLIGNGPWTLATDQSIGANSTHTYFITINVSLNLTAGSGGDNVYKSCGSTIPGTPSQGEGLYNSSVLDSDMDGIAEDTSYTCSDLPYVIHDKTIASIIPLGNNMYTVNYKIVVSNLGGIASQYNLIDQPGFDDDFIVGAISYSSNAPGNPGGVLAGSGPWLLANNQSIGIGSIHTYNLAVKLTLNLSAGSGGDNVYSKCEESNPGIPMSGEGLFNQSYIITDNDGITDQTDTICSDVPYVISSKTVSNITPLGGNMYTVSYAMTVKNIGGTTGLYDLVDQVGFDDDIVIGSASYTSDVVGNPGSALVGLGPWTLANDQSILVGATHNYTLMVKVTLDLSPGSSGDNIYSSCGSINPTTGNPKAGLFNKIRVDINNDGIAEDSSQTCADLPYIVNSKIINSISSLGSNSYNVVYKIVVTNLGAGSGQYDLLDTPGFDDDITINSASYSSDAPGNPGNVLGTTGPWILSNDQLINGNVIHTYFVTLNLTLDLSASSSGDNIYTACGQTSIPGDLSPGEGLYNRSSIDSNNDGIPEESVETCGDLPYIKSTKTIVNITPLGSGMHSINYKIIVQNLGGAVGQYDLTDVPGFDDDLIVNTASYTSNAVGNPGGVLVGSGPWILANNQFIASGTSQTYNITVKTTLDLRPGSGGDNVYTECGSSISGIPQSGEGIFNTAVIDINDDGIAEDTSVTCGNIDIVDLALRNTLVTSPPYSYGQLVTFNIEVFNQGNIPLTSIVLNDYLPSGFTFNPTDNIPGWSQINPTLLEFNAVPNISVNSSIVIPITLKVSMSCGYKDWFNYVEVKSFKDNLGNDRSLEDMDSKPNSNTAAELAILPGGPGDDDITTMDLGGNEDDHDPAGFNVFDLALRKICTAALPLNYGEIVPYEITIFNQGSISALNPKITDYVPVGFMFNAIDNPTWTYNSGTREALATYTGTLKPGDSAKLIIKLELLANLGNSNAWDNLAEIESVTDTLGNTLIDIDSNPGGTKDDDGISIDNAINDPADEDDYDPSIAPVFDLALRKYVPNKLAIYNSGDLVPFRITIFNQGNITATNIQINDYLASGYSFDSGINPGWGMFGSTLIYNSISKLYPGDSIQLNLILKVQVAIVPNISDWFNYAEIKTATDTLNVNRDNDDADSKPNSDTPWERQVVQNHPWDNQIDGNGQAVNEDEDDHDFENVNVNFVVSTQFTGRVFNDLNGDGIQTPGDPGVRDVIVNLYNCDGLFIKKDTTDVNGKYQFDALNSDNYFMRFDYSLTPFALNYGWTLQDRGANDRLDSDVNASGISICTHLDTDERDSTIDAGLVEFATYGDFVWHDKNGDGMQTVGEEGIGGVQVILYDASTNLPIRSTTTDANGLYLFKNLMPIDYYTKFNPPTGWNYTDPNLGPDFKDSDVDNSNGAGTTASTHLVPGEDDRTWDVGLFKCSMIGGRVFFDTDLDGVFDPTENGINGLNVFLVNAMTGVTVSSFRTQVTPGTPSDDGYYKFNCIKPGMFYVLFERPGHLAASDAYRGGNPDKDSDISHQFGINTTGKFTLTSGSMILNVGAGFQIKATVGDFVWIDANYNGLQDSGEQPIEGVKVFAYKTDGTLVSESISESNGQYNLDGIAQGDYFVKFDAPTSFGYTTAHVGNDEIDNDVDGTNGYGTTRTYRILAGDNRPSIDAGLVFQVLPLEWLSFEGRFNGSFTELDWKTGIELNNDHFEVERRHESENTFTVIAKISSSSEANQKIHEYQYDDYDVTKIGTYFYRIKQVDRNGQGNYSRVINIRVNSNKELRLNIFPNPTDELLFVDLGLADDSELEVRIFDETGKNVWTNPFGGFRKAGHYLESLNTSLLASGQYNLQIKTNTGTVNKRFTIAR
ncbi:MAG: SdrD B-like domain-containing protein [Saprospiraceae bacterium]